MQLEHDRQPPGSTVPARGPQPSPAQPWQPVPNLGAVTAHSCWRGRAHQGVAGDGAASLSLWNPSSPQHHAAHWRSTVQGLTRLSPVPHSPVPGNSPEWGRMRQDRRHGTVLTSSACTSAWPQR